MLALLGQLESATAAPVTIHDAFDRTVTVPAPPQRIMPIFASNVEMVAALGLADRIVGIEAYTRYPPEVLNKPLVGGRLGFSVDEVVAQRPDLIVVTPSRQAANQLVDPMERLGVPDRRPSATQRGGDPGEHPTAGAHLRRAERGEEVAARFKGGSPARPSGSPASSRRAPS